MIRHNSPQPAMSIIDTAKDIYSLAAKGLTIDLQQELMELREQALELQEENFVFAE